MYQLNKHLHLCLVRMVGTKFPEFLSRPSDFGKKQLKLNLALPILSGRIVFMPSPPPKKAEIQAFSSSETLGNASQGNQTPQETLKA